MKLKFYLWMDILISVSRKETNVLKLSTTNKTSYTYTLRLIKTMEKLGLVSVVKKGRENKVTIIDRDLATLCCRIKYKVANIERVCNGKP